MKITKKLICLLTIICLVLGQDVALSQGLSLSTTETTLAAPSAFDTIAETIRPKGGTIYPLFVNRVKTEAALIIRMALEALNPEKGSRYLSGLNINYSLDSQYGEKSYRKLLKVVAPPRRNSITGFIEIDVRTTRPFGKERYFTIIFEGDELGDMLEDDMVRVYTLGDAEGVQSTAPIDHRAVVETLEDKATPLIEEHWREGGKMIDFHGTLMPQSYRAGFIKEHLATRKAAGLFDISHMRVLEIKGEGSFDFLQYMTTNNMRQLKREGDSFYSLLADENGEIVDDIWVYRLRDSYMVVVNASNADKDIAHLRNYSGSYNVEVRDLRHAGNDSKVGIALQGPFADRVFQPIADFNLATLGSKKVASFDIKIDGERIPAYVSRTGYTGEDGFEIFLHPDKVALLWRTLLKMGKPMGLLPCGLASRDSLRIEAGYPLYGNEWNKGLSPYDLGFGWVVKLKKGDFLGKDALAQKKQDVKQKMVSIIMDKRTPHKNPDLYIEADGQDVKIGRVTSTVRSPTIGQPIALALVDTKYAEPGQIIKIKTGQKEDTGRIVETPMYRINENSPNYIVNNDEDRAAMLEKIGVSSVEELFEVVSKEAYDSYKTVCGNQGVEPVSHEEFFQKELDVPSALRPDANFLYHEELSEMNMDISQHPSFLGAGNYNYLIPEIIDMISSHRGFYTTYTPYQPETSQGNLAVFYLYQSLICRLTGMEVANVSLYDGATALTEAVFMASNIKKRKKVIIVNPLNPSYKEVLDTYKIDAGLDVVYLPFNAETMNADLDALEKELSGDVACVVAQQPNFLGELETQLKDISQMTHDNGSLFIVNVNDPHTLSSIKPPGEYDADIVTAEGQPLGNALYYGGPGLGIMATKEKYVRKMPGRIVGRTLDADGNEGFVLTLSTREQHIRREKATSNICSNEALCALRATAYLLSLGNEGLAEAQKKSVYLASRLWLLLEAIPGFTLLNRQNLGEVVFSVAMDAEELNKKLLKKGVISGLNVTEYIDGLKGNDAILFSLTNANSVEDIDKLIDAILDITDEWSGSEVRVRIEELRRDLPPFTDKTAGLLLEFQEELTREAELDIPSLTEDELYTMFWKLALMNFDIDKGLYPLGSCTMKYNARLNERIAALSGFANLHPRQPEETVQGVLKMLYDFNKYLCQVLGMPDATLQPAAGAHGEITALKIFRAYFREKGEDRKIVLTPDTSHGTNPASAAMGGMKIVKVKTKQDGTTDMDDLRDKIATHGKDIAGIMLTIPNTLGIFEAHIPEISELMHSIDAQVYMDGANLNAIIGQVRPGDLGVDAVHVNLHKTFDTPHGGGGPGAGPVAVAKHLAKYLPKPTIELRDERYYLNSNLPHSIGQVLANIGNVGVILKANAYRLALGSEGLRSVSENAVINANYLMAILNESGLFKVYHAPNSYRMHEFVLEPARKGVKAIDIAKALLDWGFHPPTTNFPHIEHIIDEALMIEPTETASKAELDRFAKALIAIAIRAGEDQDKVDPFIEQVNTATRELSEARAAITKDMEAAAKDQAEEALRQAQERLTRAKKELEEAEKREKKWAPLNTPVRRLDEARAAREKTWDLKTSDIKGEVDKILEKGTLPEAEDLVPAPVHNSNMQFINHTANLIDDYPVNMTVELALIPEEDLKANMRTIACVIALHNQFGLNARYKFVEKEGGISLQSAKEILFDEIRDVARLKSLDADALIARVTDEARTDDSRVPLEVHIMHKNDLAEISKLADDILYVAMSDGKDAAGIPLRDFLAATNIGLGQAACRKAKLDDAVNTDGEPTLPDTIKAVFPMMQEIYKRLLPEEILTEETVAMMIDNTNPVARKNLLIDLALPPIVRAVLENLKKYHERMQLLLQAA